jgi:hypothetical protein
MIKRCLCQVVTIWLATSFTDNPTVPVISLFDCILCCIVLVLYLSSIVVAVPAVPYLSSNVPFSMYDFKQVFHFHTDFVICHNI